MRRASTWMLEKRTQTPSSSPDLISAENERLNLIGNAHSDWHHKPGHISLILVSYRRTAMISAMIRHLTRPQKWKQPLASLTEVLEAIRI